MSETIRKSHNVSVLMYHFVCPAKYRRVVIDEDVDRVIKETCEGIQERYEIRFLEVGTDKIAYLRRFLDYDYSGAVIALSQY